MRIVLLCALLVLLVACSAPSAPSALDTFARIREQAIANAESDFERVCYENNHGWMKMMPSRDGVQLGDEQCYGCMPEANMHLCDEQEYRAYLDQRK